MIDRRTFGKAFGLAVASATAIGAAPGIPATAAPMPRDPGGPTAGKVELPVAPAFERMRQVNAGELNMGYAELGPANGRPLVLLHGWPYDIHSYVDVAPILAARGYRVIVPYLRGHGTTTFRSAATFRNAQQSVVALDIIALLDALRIRRAVFAGYDWGTRTADIIAALWPHRVKALVAVTGYLVTNRETNENPIAPTSEWAWWYQYYFATERGRRGLENPEYRVELARQVWTFSSPTWAYDEETFARAAAAFTNPDYVDIVIHNYRWRLGLADGDPKYDALERRLAAAPPIGVPTITIDGEKDPFTPPGDGSMYRSHFVGPYDHRTFRGIGHNVPQEAPEQFARAVQDADAL